MRRWWCAASRNTSVAIGAQVAFVAAGPVIAGISTESGYTNAF